MQDRPSTGRSFIQKHLLDQPSSVKTVGYGAMSAFAFVATIFLAWTERSHLHIREETTFDCVATVDQPPTTVLKNDRLISITMRVHDEKAECREAVGSWKRKGVKLPARLLTSPLLAKGQPVEVEFGLDTKDRLKVTALRSDQGTIIADQSVINEGIDIYNKGNVPVTVYYLLAGLVTAFLSLKHYLRSRRT